jgi:hypothetical protein
MPYDITLDCASRRQHKLLDTACINCIRAHINIDINMNVTSRQSEWQYDRVSMDFLLESQNSKTHAMLAPPSETLHSTWAWASCSPRVPSHPSALVPSSF